MRASLDVDPVPELLREVDRHPPDMVARVEEVRRQRHAERLRLPHAVLGRQRVDGVLHGVGRQHAGIVAVDIRGVEIALEPDRHAEVEEIVAILTPVDGHEADAGLAVRRLLDHDRLLQGGLQQRAGRADHSTVPPPGSTRMDGWKRLDGLEPGPARGGARALLRFALVGRADAGAAPVRKP